jgi:hypothetical protein
MSAPVLLLLLVAGVVVWLWLRAQSSRGAEAQLLRICRGSHEQVERLIAGELARAPDISRVEAAARAVARYQRDNR